MSPRPVFLDVDPSLIEKNLKITSDQDELSRLFPSETEYPSKVVKPSPGFCIKTKDNASNKKVFINICQTDAIPPPADISDEELVELIQSEEPSMFRVPMSIANAVATTDKKGEESKQIDVAINTKFFKKIETNYLFKNFFIQVALEGVSDKYSLKFTENSIVLKNRACVGNLQLHRIQQREIDEKMGRATAAPQSVIQELKGESSSLESTPAKPKIEILSSAFFDGTGNVEPEYRFFKKTGEPNCLIAEFKLPNIVESSEILLDVGEDRIILESQPKRYFLDKFLPCNLLQNEVESTFNKSTKILTVTMPLKSAT